VSANCTVSTTAGREIASPKEGNLLRPRRQPQLPGDDSDAPSQGPEA